MTWRSFKRVVPAGIGGCRGTRTGGVAPRPATAAAIRDSRRLDRTGPCRPQGLFGRVGRSGTEEFRRGGARLGRLRRAARLLDARRPELRRHPVLELELLLGGKGEELVGRLLGLERSLRALAPVHNRGQGLRVLRSEGHTSEL